MVAEFYQRCFGEELPESVGERRAELSVDASVESRRSRGRADA